MQNQNILQVCLSPSWGGLEMVAFETALLLQENKRNCWTVAATNSPLAARLKEENLPFIEIPRGLSHFPRNIWTLRELIKTHSINYVISQQIRELFFIRCVLRPFPKIKLIGFSHTFLGVLKRDPYHQWLYRRVHTLVALTLRHQTNLKRRLGLPSEKFKIIPNSVNTLKFHPNKRNLELRREWDVTNSSLLIGLVGRLDKAKGQALLLKAAALCKKKGSKNFKIILVGEETKNEPGTLEKLKGLTQELKLQDTVVFAGYRRDIPEVMASLDIAVMASDAETFGRVIIEAMASGTPVIATRAGGVMDIIEDTQDGLLFRPKNEIDLADKLTQLIGNSELRIKISSAALAKVHARYSSNIVHQEILSLFSETT